LTQSREHCIDPVAKGDLAAADLGLGNKSRPITGTLRPDLTIAVISQTLQ
jgi:hypothetical protein